jgi:hypothetical protein
MKKQRVNDVKRTYDGGDSTYRYEFKLPLNFNAIGCCTTFGMYDWKSGFCGLRTTVFFTLLLFFVGDVALSPLDENENGTCAAKVKSMLCLRGQSLPTLNLQNIYKLQTADLLDV